MSTVQTVTTESAESVLNLRSPTEAKLQQQDPKEPIQDAPYRFAHLMPTFPQNEHYPPLEPFNHVDPGHRALTHADPRAYLKSATSISEITPGFGSEVRGVQLEQLDSNARDELALHVAQRGLVVFRDQEGFINSSPETYLDWGRHFGRLHIHPTAGYPQGYNELHLVYRDGTASFNFERTELLSSTSWHSDVSYELQPPGITTFFLVDQPASGGDTLFSSQRTILNMLSPSLVAFLRTLKAVHSGVVQANYSRSGKRGGTVRREPVETVHPVVRKHPVTGEEALWVNRQFTRFIIGLKKEESDAILNMLYDHIEKSGEAQVRMKWSPGTVAVWDNRLAVHSAVLDFNLDKTRRHGVRITPQAERPIPALEGLKLDD